MKILFIISQFKPAQTPNTLRWTPLLEYFTSKGHEVFVLTTLRSGISLKSTDGALMVYRAGYNTLMDFLSDKMGKNSRRNETGGNGYSGIPGPGRLLLEKFVDKTWRKSYWPDGSKLFLKPGVRLGSQIIQDNKISHVVSVGLPFTCHLIAKQLKEKNKNLHWHMDIQDPFCYSKEFWVNNFEKYEIKNIEAEKEAFDAADSISLTNPKAEERYLELFSEAKNKISIIPPLFDSTITEDTSLVLDPDKIHFGFFGSFYKGVRSPKSFIQFLNLLHKRNPTWIHKIQFHFFGQQNKFSYPILNSEEKVRRYFIIHGLVSREDSLKFMTQMNVLVNFGNTTDYHLPSKVVDLLYMNKPIINFISNQNDSTKQFLKSYADILNLNINNIDTEKLELFIDFVSKNRKESTPSLKNVENYTVTKIGDIYLNALKA